MNAKMLGAMLLVMTLPAMLHAQETLTDAKKADIRQLLELTGAQMTSQRYIDAVLKNIMDGTRKAQPSLPARGFAVIEDEVRLVVKERMAKDFFELLYPVYNNYFTQSEVKQLVRFYKTPIGAKVAQVSPQLLEASVQAGQKWGLTLGPILEGRITARLKKEGLLK